jgi:hypothetical protein
MPGESLFEPELQQYEWAIIITQKDQRKLYTASEGYVVCYAPAHFKNIEQLVPGWQQFSVFLKGHPWCGAIRTTDEIGDSCTLT